MVRRFDDPADEHDFYENLFLSEKIVDGHVKLSLPTLSADDNASDEEDKWAAWERANHERRERVRGGGGKNSRSSTRQKKDDERRAHDRRPASPARRGRALRDPTYAKLLDRRDENAARVEAAKRRMGGSGRHAFGEAERRLSPSPAKSRSGGRRNRTKSPLSSTSGGSRLTFRGAGEDSEDYDSDSDSDSDGGGGGGGIVRSALGKQLLETRRWSAQRARSASPGVAQRGGPRGHASSVPPPRRPGSARPGSASAFASAASPPPAPAPVDDDPVCFGRHHTFEGEAARARREAEEAAAAAKKKMGKKAPPSRPGSPFKARSDSHWSPYDRVGVVNADP